MRSCRAARSSCRFLLKATAPDTSFTTAKVQPASPAAALWRVPDLFASGNNVALGWLTDGVFVNGSGIELTRVWTIGSAIEHYWKPGVLRSDLTGAYTNVSYSSLAKGYFSDVGGCTPGSGPLSHGAAKSSNFTLTNCDPDWQYFQGGLATWWTPEKISGLQLGFEVFYTQIWSAFKGPGTILAANGGPGARPAGSYSINDQGIWAAVFRFQRSFNTRDRT